MTRDSAQRRSTGSSSVAGVVPLLILAALAAVASPVIADDPRCPEEVGRWSRGGPTRVIAAGDFIFLDSQYGLLVADVSDHGAPRIVGEVTLGAPRLSPIQYLALGDDHLFAVTYHSLSVIDVSDPTTPRVESVVALTGPLTSAWMDVAAAGNYVYVAQSSVGLRVFDAADPASLIEVGVVAAPVGGYGMAIDGGFLYVGGSDGMSVFDIADPANPVQVGHLSMTTPSWNLDADDGRVFVVCFGSGLTVVDVSDPTVPVAVGQYNRSGIEWDVAVTGTIAYLATFDGLLVVDVSKPSAPVEIGFADQHSMNLGVAVDGGHAFLAASSDGLHIGLHILNVQIPSAPSVLSVLHVNGVNDVAIAGDHVYAAARSAGLRVVDVGDVAQPVEVGLAEIGDVTDVDVAADHAYVGTFDALRVVDITDPVAPVPVGSVPLPGWVREVVVSGDHAYVSTREQGLHVIDISAPSSPFEVGSLWTPDGVSGLAVAGDLAYLAAGGDGVLVIDISDPSHPVEVGSFQRLDFVQDVALSNGFLSALFVKVYHGDGDVFAVDFSTLDISHPPSPTEIRSITVEAAFWAYGPFSGGLPPHLTVAGSYAYIAGTSLTVVDVADPASPSLIEPCESWHDLTGVAVSDGHIFASDGAGFAILNRLDEVLFRDGFATGDNHSVVRGHSVGGTAPPFLATSSSAAKEKSRSSSGSSSSSKICGPSSDTVPLIRRSPALRTLADGWVASCTAFSTGATDHNLTIGFIWVPPIASITRTALPDLRSPGPSATAEPQPALAADVAMDSLVTADWLSEHLEDPGLVVLDCTVHESVPNRCQALAPYL